MKRIKFLLSFFATLSTIIAIFFVLKSENSLLIHPKGIIAQSELKLIGTNILLMLIVIVPTFLLLFWIIWISWCKKSQMKPNKRPSHKALKELILWIIPSLIIAVMTMVTWKATHKLDPYKPIKTKAKMLPIQVVALDWKWLFIYPEQGIATVNFVEFPANTSIHFTLSADGSPMNSFWIPQLSGQIYAMTGMTTSLYVMADGSGEYVGRAAEINGEGFADMTFVAKSSSQSDFNNWVKKVKQSPLRLTYSEYDKLIKRSKKNPIEYYSYVEKDLFNKIVKKNPHSSSKSPRNSTIFGKLSLKTLPHAWFTVGATCFILIAGLMIAIFLTKKRCWSWLWHEWLTSTDPKKIGTMYILFASIMFFRGMIDVGMIWLQQSLGADSPGYLEPEHFQEIFTAHGDIMVFFVTMGFFFGIMNWIIPLQIGARDLAFPFLNSLGLWLTVAGGILINLFFMVGGSFANTGWLAIAPLSEIEFNPGVGVDYLIWSLQISGLGSLLAAINFITTIVKKRAPGMTLMKMPLFVWTSLGSMVLVISSFPVLTATLLLLWLDRFFGMHFFTEGFGGNQMMYFNLIWMWGHPEVYILVLPAFGMYSEIVTTFSQKKIFGYVSMVCATIAITLLSYLVWLHHFFTMGAGADVNSFFSIMTMLIAIPSGVQVFNWILTMYKGKVKFSSPMYWFIGFLCTFMLGGMAGVLMAAPPADFQIHNSLFLVAHFHTMIIGVALFGVFAGTTYWFPKIMGFKLNERLGKRAFWFWLVGFFVSFIPLYLLGLMGATRRLDHYASSTGWQPLFITASIGFCIIMCGIITQILQVIVSIKEKNKNLDMTGDPWNGRTLEWSTSSPPPFYNFAVIPTVTSRDEFWNRKKENYQEQKQYKDIVLPKNTGMGIYLSAFALLLGFSLVWHIFWLTLFTLIGIITCIIILSFNENTEYVLPASTIAQIEKSNGKG